VVYPWERPLGARPSGDGTTTFRVWAPKPARVALRLRGEDHALTDEGFGVRSARVPAAAGDDYWFVGVPAPAKTEA
jgi:1,4-alpha-glucan branching enzyme